MLIYRFFEKVGSVDFSARNSYLKSKVYKPLPKTLDDLKENITSEIQKINISILKSTFSNFTKRFHLLVEKNVSPIFKLCLKWCIGLKIRFDLHF